MKSQKIKTAPKPPSDFDTERATLWKDTFGRIVEALGFAYRTDSTLVEALCRAHHRLEQVRTEANTADLYDERGKPNQLFKLESELSQRLKAYYRSVEATIRERKVEARRDNSASVHGGQPGLRQKPAREGIKHNGPKPPSSISWLDEARKKSAEKEDTVH